MKKDIRKEFTDCARAAGMTPGEWRRIAGKTPESQAFAAGIVEDLAGAYTPEGIRRWFARPRVQLDGRAPADVLAGAWRPDHDMPLRVKALSRALRGGGPGPAS